MQYSVILQIPHCSSFFASLGLIYFITGIVSFDLPSPISVGWAILRPSSACGLWYTNLSWFFLLSPWSFPLTCVCISCSSHVRFFANPQTAACQTPLGFSRQEYWSGLPSPSPGDLPDPGIKPRSLHGRQILYHLSHQGSPFPLKLLH